MSQLKVKVEQRLAVRVAVATRPGPQVFATHVSNIVNPLAVAVPLMIIAGLREHAFYLGFFHVLLALVGLVAVPAAYVVSQLRSGAISDLHISQRSQRTRPLVISLVSAMVTLLLLDLTGAQHTLLKLVFGTLLTMVFLAGITIFWKISFHAAATTGAVVTALWLLGTMAVPLAVLVPLVAWARVELRAHTAAQVICGTVAGAFVSVLVLTLL